MSIFKGPDELDLTNGDIKKGLFYLSLPVVITNLMQTGYNLADTFWLGQYGTGELAAIGFAFPMVFLFISIAIGLSVAGAVLVAQNIGAENDSQAEYAASQTVIFTIIASIVLGIIGYFIVGPLLSLLGASDTILPLATDYMQIISLGLVFMFGFILFMALMRGYGDTITPMIIMGGTVALNIVIDPILIFGFNQNPLFMALGLENLSSTLYTATGYNGSGIEGAAIATIFSRGIATIIGFGIMLRGNRGLKINISQMKPDPEYLSKMLRVGIPASADVMGRAIAVNLMLLVVSMFSTPVIAAYGIVVRLYSLIFLPANAVSQSVETITGQNIGAEKEERVQEVNNIAAKAMFTILTVVGVIIWLLAEPLVGIFTPNQAVVSVGKEFLRYVALTFGGIGVIRAYAGGFRGTGKTLTAAIISITSLGLVRLPVSAILATSIGQQGIWIGFVVSNIFGMVVAYLWFQRGTWRGMNLADNKEQHTTQTSD